MQELLERTNSLSTVMGFIAYADEEADRLWTDTGEALKEIGLEIYQSKSCYTRQEKTEWNRSTLSFKEKIVVLGTEATERNSTAADEDDASLVHARLGEACEVASHVETITQVHLDMRKTEALWLLTSESNGESPGLRRESCEPQETEASGRDAGSKSKRHLREADGETI